MNVMTVMIGSIAVVLFAIERFHTPYINRYSTTATNFYTGAVLYSVSYLGAFFLLAMYPSLLTEMLGDQYANSQFGQLPQELVAALALTVLLPNLPGIRNFDMKFKQAVFELVNVPREVRLIVDQLASSEFRVPQVQQATVRQHLLDLGFAEADICFEDADHGGYQLTKISYLLDQLESWRSSGQYRNFSLMFTDKIDTLRRAFQKQCPLYLGMANAQQLDVSGINEIEAGRIHTIISNSRKACDEFAHSVLRDIYELIGRALFSKLNNETGRRKQLHELGFSLPVQRGYFSWDLMAGLFLAIFIVYFVRFLFSDTRMNVVLITTLIALAYCAAVFWATYPKLNWSFAQREPGEGRRFAYYVLAMACTFGTVSVFRIGIYGLEYHSLTQVKQQFMNGMPWQMLSVGMTLMLCTFIENRPFKHLRVLEGVSGMVFTPGLFFLVTQLMPQREYGVYSYLAPAIIGFLVAYTVPHWYRHSRRSDAPCID